MLKKFINVFEGKIDKCCPLAHWQQWKHTAQRDWPLHPLRTHGPRKSDPLGETFTVCFANVCRTWVQMKTVVCEPKLGTQREHFVPFWLPNHMTIDNLELVNRYLLKFVEIRLTKIRWLRQPRWPSQIFAWMCRSVSAIRPIFWRYVRYVDIRYRLPLIQSII